jgi:DNA-binding NarL/FixJ family response regulator
MQVSGAIRDIELYLGEPKEGTRQGLVSMLRGMGLKNVSAFSSAERLTGALKVKSPDALLVSSDIHANLFGLLKSVRDQDIGLNPFTVISVVIDSDNDREFSGAMRSGADDIMTSAPAAAQVMDRLKKVAFKRLPFIALPDYIGPDRRQPDQRKVQVKEFEAVNTLKDKIEGRVNSPQQLETEINDMMREVRASQLQGYSQKFSFLCRAVIKAYETDQPHETINKTLTVLQTSLNKASLTAEKNREIKLANVCSSFADKIDTICRERDRPTEQELKLLKTLTQAYQMAQEKVSGSDVPH